jgi:hypothetical protein
VIDKATGRLVTFGARSTSTSARSTAPPTTSVPIDGARSTVRRLAEIGLIANLIEYPGLAHHTSREERRDLAQAIEQAAGSP